MFSIFTRQPFFIKDLHELTEIGSDVFMFRGKSITEVSIMGTVVEKLKYRDERYLGYVVDDGTGTVICAMDLESPMYEDGKRARELYTFYLDPRNCRKKEDRVTLTGLVKPIKEMYEKMSFMCLGQVVGINGRLVVCENFRMLVVRLICPVENIKKEIAFIEEILKQKEENSKNLGKENN